ncbi:MAG: glycosyltransferase family 9 protein [Candidatus Omnitrophota bacterium]
MIKPLKNILVVRTDRIGDVILTTPALAYLRQAYPKSKISLMVTPATVELVDGNPYLDEVIVYDRQEKDKGPIRFWKFIFALRKKKFDCAIVYHTKKRTNLICFLAGIPERVGYHNNKFGFLLTKKIQDDRPLGTKHEAQYCLDLLEALGIKATNYMNLHVPIKTRNEMWVKQFLVEHNIKGQDLFIAIHPGGSDETKRWPPEKFAELIGLIREKYSVRMMLIGGLETQEIADAIKSSCRWPFMDAVALTTVGQLVCLLRQSCLLISNDSGPVHIASAVGTPVISIFGHRSGGISHTRWRPLGQKAFAIHRDQGCEECAQSDEESCLSCLQAIEAREVFRAVESLISLPERSKSEA